MDLDRVDPDWPAPVDQPAPRPSGDPSDEADTPPGSENRSGRSLWLVAALAVLVCIAAAVALFAGDGDGRPAADPAPSSTTGRPPAPSPGNTRTGSCGPDEAAAVAAALPTVPPDRKTGKQWSRTPESSHYDPCAELSAVVVTVQDGTRSAPDLALMFHRGAFVGTATPKAYPFTGIEGPASTPDLVVLTYRTRQSCDICDDGTLTIVGFQWKGDKVQMLDTPPESLDSPP